MHQVGHKVALLVMPTDGAPQILLSKNMARLNPRRSQRAAGRTKTTP
jgi:hypothetical protein